MKRHLYGTRFTTGCGHSWRRRYPWWTIAELAGCTTDCGACGELLIIPRQQFSDHRSDRYPFRVHMPRFHVWMNQQDPRWPVNGASTGFVEFGPMRTGE